MNKPPMEANHSVWVPSGLEGLLWRWSGVALAIYWPALALATHWPRLDLPNPSVGLVGLDKLLHVVSFALLALLLAYVAMAARPTRRKSGVWMALCIATVYAIADEMTQHVFERTTSWNDLVADLIGIAGTGIVIWRLQSTRPGWTTDVITAQAANEPPDDDPTNHPSAFVGHALLVGAVTGLSRLLGLVRDAVLAACFGMTTVTDAFWVGFVVPNLFRRLFGEGALTAALIPVYTDLLHRDRVTAQRLISLCVAILAAVLGLLTLIGELLLAQLSAGPWSSDTLLAIRLTMIMLPYMPLVCLVALLGGVLQVHRRFGPPAAAPILLNMAMIGATVIATASSVAPSDLRQAIRIVAFSVVLAGLMQLGWQAWAVARCGVWTIRFKGAGGALGSVAVMMVPTVLGMAAFQVNTLFDSLIAWGLSPKSGGPKTLDWLGWSVDFPVRIGAVTGVQYAQRLYQFPMGVFGIALATAIFPALAGAAAARQVKTHRLAVPSGDRPGHNDDRDGTLGPFHQIVQLGLRLAMFVGLPASVGLILVRVPLSRVIFERGAFALEDSVRVANILAGYASAVWAYTMIHVLTRAFYALKDARTPLWISGVAMSVNLILNLVLVWPLGAAALAWSTAICAVGQTVLLLLAIRRHVGAIMDSGVWWAWARSAFITAVMAAVLTPVTLAYQPAALSYTATAVQLLVLVTLGITIVLVGARLMGARELNWLMNPKKVSAD